MNYSEPVVIPYVDMGDKADINILLVILIIALVFIIAAGVFIIVKFLRRGGRAETARLPVRLPPPEEEPPPIFNTVTLSDVSNAASKWTVSVAADRTVTGGREDGCEIQLAESSVSRRQFKLLFDCGVLLQNLSVSNITKVNGVPAAPPVMLKAGDVIKCGRAALVVESLTYTETAEGAENG